MKVINRVWTLSYELKNIGFKNRKALMDLSCSIQLWSMKKKFLKKLYCIYKGDAVNYSSRL